jgi:hypothetical protein
MEITKNMKAGYQGKPDAMREKAERLMNHPGEAKNVYPSKSCADKVKIRPYKEGGSVKQEKAEPYKETTDKKMDTYKEGGTMKKDKKCQKFAMGGVAKIRHEEATSQGMPRNFKKISLKDVL